MPIETWTCHICGKERPDALIKVFTQDSSKRHNLPAGTVQSNVRYCADNPACFEGAKAKEFF